MRVPIRREQVVHLFTLRDENPTMPLRELGEKSGMSKASAMLFLRHREENDPYIDEIALMRAMEGDATVFQNLTKWELNEFYDRVSDKWLRMADAASREKYFLNLASLLSRDNLTERERIVKAFERRREARSVPNARPLRDTAQADTG